MTTSDLQAHDILKQAGLCSGAIAAAASKVLNASSTALGEAIAAVNSSIGNVTQLGQQALSQGTSADDETTYPGLEQPLLPQQELR